MLFVSAGRHRGAGNRAIQVRKVEKVLYLFSIPFVYLCPPFSLSCCVYCWVYRNSGPGSNSKLPPPPPSPSPFPLRFALCIFMARSGVLLLSVFPSPTRVGFHVSTLFVGSLVNHLYACCAVFENTRTAVSSRRGWISRTSANTYHSRGKPLDHRGDRHSYCPLRASPCYCRIRD